MKSVLITSSILIAFIAALRPLLRGRVDPRAQYALWLLAALRLLLPLELAPSAYSALALLERAEAPAQVAQAIGQTTVPLLAMSPERAIIQADQEYGEHDGVIRLDPSKQVQDRAEELMRGPTLSELAAKYARPVWLGGGLAAAGWFLLVNFQLRRKLRRALPVEADCPLPVYVTPELPSPCLCGLFRPAVYVTPAALADPVRLRHVLAHELTHYRHKDHWWAWARCLCLCVYWFDPLVWWAAALSRQDCELACDAGTISRLGEQERLSYGRTLVAMIAAGRASLLQTATTMTGSKRRVQERVRLIARRPKTVLALALAAALLAGCAVGCTFTGAPEEAPSPSLSPSTLQERLMDMPEDLQDRVTFRLSSGEPSRLADYWFDVPAEWTDTALQASPLMSVYQFSQEEFMADLGRTTAGQKPFARGNDTYYVIAWSDGADYAPGQEEAYHSAYQAVYAYAVEQVLATEGVEPFSVSDWEADPGTLTARLLTLPETLNLPPVDVYPASENDPDCLATYWLSDSKWVDLWSGYLMNLYLCAQDKIEENVSRGIWASGGNGLDTFARSGELYYSIVWPSDGRYEDDGEYWPAFYAIREYVKAQVLATEGVEPYTPDSPQPGPASTPVQAAVDRLMASPSVELQLAIGSQDDPGSYVNYVWTTDPSQDFYASYLQDLTTAFSWEEFDWGTSEDAHLPDPPPTSSYLRITSSDLSTYIRVYEDSDLVAVHDSENGTNWYHAKYTYDSARRFSPFEYLRRLWFDVLELNCLRASAITVPHRGQSHEEIAREWAEGWEGALYRAAPGSIYACTYVEISGVTVDLPDWLEGDELNDFARAHGLPAGGFGTDWFGFSYQAVVVPVDQSTSNGFWAGNTGEYQGDSAPEGALSYSRVGILHRTSQGWLCEGVGTGW